jgi:hypothetical protein
MAQEGLQSETRPSFSGKCANQWSFTLWPHIQQVSLFVLGAIKSSAFICQSLFYFLLHITPVAQRHLPGTGTRGTSRIDQQAYSLDWRCSGRTLQSGGTTMVAWVFLSRFHFILMYWPSCGSARSHGNGGHGETTDRFVRVKHWLFGLREFPRFFDDRATAGSCFDSLPCDQHFEFNSLAAAHRKYGLTDLRQGLPMVNQVHGCSFPLASPTRTAPREASPGRRASPGAGKSRTKASWTVGICRFPRCPPSG